MTATRPLRADARRNRDAILLAARETYETEGVLASLDGIAVRAGVGNATLYRNFPTRDDLLAAVMQTSIELAVAEAEELARTASPRDALIEWAVRLAWRLRIWHDLPYCVAAAHHDPESPMTSTASPLVGATGALLARARGDGSAHDSITADDLYELITMLSWGIDRFGDDEAAARRRVQLATAGVLR